MIQNQTSEIVIASLHGTSMSLIFPTVFGQPSPREAAQEVDFDELSSRARPDTEMTVPSPVTPPEKKRGWANSRLPLCAIIWTSSWMSSTVPQEIRTGVVCDAKRHLGRTRVMMILATYSSVGELTFSADFDLQWEQEWEIYNPVLYTNRCRLCKY